MTQGIIEKALLIYGPDAQLDMLVEECAELIQARQKLLRTVGKGPEAYCLAMQNFVEELADVKIMLLQAERIVGADQVNREMDRKLARLAARLAENKLEGMGE